MGTVTGSHTYTGTICNRVAQVTVYDDDNPQFSGHAAVAFNIPSHGPTQFYVADQSAHHVFDYDQYGNSSGGFDLSHNNQRVWGIVTNSAADTLWMVDSNQNARIYKYTSAGVLLGYWIADGTGNSSADIASNGGDIWVVDKSTLKVYYFAGGAAWADGLDHAPTSSFPLATGNTSPSGMVTDGVTIWIADDHAGNNTVYVYDLLGDSLGSWTLDSNDTSPAGITLNPNYWSNPAQGGGQGQCFGCGGGGSNVPATDLWTVDRATDKIYRYLNATSWRSGSHSATSSFGLVPGPHGDHDPEGVADPVVITLQGPGTSTQPPYSQPSGTSYLVTGTATPDPSTHSPVTDVLVNGATAGVIDAGGNFFTATTVQPGNNTFPVTGTDAAGTISTPQTVTVTGYTPPSPAGNPIPRPSGAGGAGIDFSLLSDVTTSFTVSYGRTSFNSGTNVLYADSGATNSASFNIRTPLLVGVRHISSSSVRVRNYTGLLADGTPYYDLSSMVSNGILTTGSLLGPSLTPDASALTPELAFYDPEGVRFTYDLVFMGHLNHPSRFTSVPVVTVEVGSSYLYAPTAFDPDGDPVTFAKISGPANLNFSDTAHGALLWTPSDADVGTYPVRLRVYDNNGGSSDQTYVISVLSSNMPNLPPVFTTTPVVDATVYDPTAPAGTTGYSYAANAIDMDGDTPITYSLDSASIAAGLSVTATGLVTWNPGYARAGTTQNVTLTASDGHSNSATQSYQILVRQAPSNLPPFFVTTAPISVPQGSVYSYPARADDSDGDSLIYSFVSGQNGLLGAYIDQALGNITWPTAGIAQGNYTTTIRVDDGRGGYDTQTFAVTVTLPNTAGAIYGTKYNDQNGDGQRGDPTPPATTLSPINMQAFPITQAPIAIDYYQPGNSIVEAVGTGFSGQNTNLYLVNSSGSETLYASLLNVPFQDGKNISAVQPGNQGGFTPGDIFLPGLLSSYAVAKVSQGGLVQEAWKSLPSIVGRIDQVYVDQTGVFGGELLVVTEALPPNGPIESIWRIRADGSIDTPNPSNPQPFATGIPGQPQGDGSLITVPNNSAVYGPLAGKILIVSDGLPAYMVDSTGAVAPVGSSGLDGAEGVAIVPAAANFFAEADNQLSIYVGEGHQFAPIQGQLIAVNENTKSFSRVYWDALSSSLKTVPLLFTDMTSTSGATQPWEEVAFLPAALGPVDPPREPGLGQWQIYLDLNHDGHLDPGDPYTFTDNNGNYSFTGLAAGTCTVREVAQTGWTQTAPSAGSYTVTVTAGQAVSGLDFGNHFTGTTPPPNVAPQFAANPAPPTTATVGVIYRYTPVATDTDLDPLTFDLPVHPAGMAVDPPSGTIVWRPTSAQANQTYSVLLRVQDGRGGVALNPFSITVAAANQVPVITSAPITTGVAGVPYSYRVLAQDADSDTLSYSVTNAPANLVFNGNYLQWASPVAGTYNNVTITVNDNNGATVTQIFNLTIAASGVNQPPVITSQTPPAGAQVGLPYFYQVTASDPDNDPLTYSIVSVSPSPDPNNSHPLTINSTTGLLTWTPTGNDLQTYSITLRVTDAGGLYATLPPFSVKVVDQFTNQPPAITSIPPLSATVGQPYFYNLTASDQDGDPIAFALLSGPVGMSLSQTGALRWTPDVTQVGSQSVTLEASDPYGATATQTFTITVRGVNLPPVITSEPVLQAQTSTLYTYAVVASDADGDPLTYSITYPSSLNSNHPVISSAGLVTWTPTSSQTGNFAIAVTVSDGPNSVTQSYTLTVSSTVNHPPVITSSPAVNWPANSSYTYQVTYSDIDSETPYTYSLILPSQLSGPSINSSGLLTWSNVPAGQYLLGVKVTDFGGAYGQQFFTLNVAANAAPTITSVPNQTITAGLLFTYNVQASDADNTQSNPNADPLTFSMTGAPSGMTIDPNTGRISMQTAVLAHNASPVVYSGITVTVTDSFGQSATTQQPFSLTVNPEQTQPTIELQISPTQPTIGGNVTFIVLATDTVGVTTESLTINNVAYPVDDHGEVHYTIPSAGTYNITATASNGAGQSSSTSTSFTLTNPLGTPPTITLDPGTAALNNTVVTSPVALIGSVSDDHTNGVSYTITAIPLDGSMSTPINCGSAVSPATSVSFLSGLLFDPTNLANGDYNIQIAATDVDDNLTTIRNLHVSVEGHLKLGHETLSVTDLMIPVSGIPITITRTYDSLFASQSRDFGYGWRLGFGDAKLEVTLAPDAEVGFGGFPAFLDGTRVYVTMPGGEREGFTFQGQVSNTFFGYNYYAPTFIPDPGVLDQLSVQNVLLDKDPNSGEYYMIGDFGIETYNPADPVFGNMYTITNLDGTGYEVTADLGQLVGMTARNGNSLTITPNAITSNTGRTVQIVRDPQNRVTAITDPRGNSVQYAYDINGNLVSVTDRIGNQTSYAYNDSHAHYLTGITDPLHVQQLTVSYDPTSARISQLQDAAPQHSVTMAYTVNASTFQQTITDPSLQSGQQTATATFNARGNLSHLTDATGAQTDVPSYQNDLPTTLTRTVRLLGGGTSTLTTNLTYSALTGQPTSITNPDGSVGRLTYNQFGQPLTLSDPLGNTISNSYDNNGNLLSTVTAAGVVTSYGYDAHNNQSAVMSGGGIVSSGYDSFGNLQSRTTPTGVTTTFSYDANGNQTGSIMTWVDPYHSNNTQTLTTSAIYDGNDHQTSSTDVYGHTSRTQYDAAGRVQSTTDVLGNTTSYLYDSRGNVIQTTTPGSIVNGAITYLVSDTVYDAEGRAIYADDPHVVGQADVRGTRTIYDSDRRVTETDRLDNLVITVTPTQSDEGTSSNNTNYTVVSTNTSVYNDLGQVTSSTDAAGLTTQYTYDANGRQTQVTHVYLPTNMAYDTEKTVYDAAGHVTDSIDALSHDTHYVYDGDGRVTQTIFADGSSTRTTYDSAGRQSSAADQMGRTTNYQYDSFARLTAVILPMVFDPQTSQNIRPTTKYTYDIYGNMNSIQDAIGVRDTVSSPGERVTSFTFDQFGHQLTHILPMGQSESMTYDAFGRLSTQTDFANLQTVYHYDALGRVYEKDYSGGSNPSETVSYQFDSLGRENQITDTVSGQSPQVWTYTFDIENRVASIASPQGTINYAYVDATGFHSETSTVNSDIVYVPDPLQRVSQVKVIKQNGVTLSTPLVTTYYYTSVGNIDHITYPNGTQTAYGYDSLNRLVSVTNSLGGTTLSSYVYTLEADGLRTGVTETELESNGQNSTVTKAWTYDNLQRLTQEAVTVSGASPGYTGYTATYTFDLVGNRLSKTTITGPNTEAITHTYNNNDQLLTETALLNNASEYSTVYGYDGNGSENSVSRTGTNPETDTYAYDFRHMLKTATISRTESGQQVVISSSYLYSDDVIRVQTQQTTTIGNGSPTTTTTQFLVDPENPTGYTQVLEEHTNGSSTPSVSYIIGLSVFGQTDSNGMRYFMPDGQGSTRQLVDGTGNIVIRYAYDAYGNILGTQVGVVNPPASRILYASQQLDAGLAQYYLRARYYVTSSGRFVSRDSYYGNVVDPRSQNKYSYGLDNPLIYVDPSGNIPWWVGMGTLGFIFVASNWAFGNIVHGWIGADYVLKTDGWFDTAISTILSRPGTFLGILRPDLADKFGFVRAVYEIKPVGSYLEGRAKLTLYLTILNAVGGPPARVWVPGWFYDPPPIVPVKGSTLAFVAPPENGVILYQVVDFRLAVAWVVGVVIAEVFEYWGISVLNATLGYA
jgi:RHS repeat-associated protein